MLLVGSFRFNCRLPDSDINALCLLPRYITREDFLAHLPPLLRLNPGVSIVFALPSEPTSPFSSPTVVARSVFCNVTFTYTLVTHQWTCRFNGYDISIVPAFLNTDTVSAALDVIKQAQCLTPTPSCLHSYKLLCITARHFALHPRGLCQLVRTVTRLALRKHRESC